MNASEVVDRALELLLAKDMAGFAGLWAQSGVIEFPFAPPGYPPRVEGRAAIHVLTGPEALSYADAAAIVARRIGSPVRHRTVTAAELARHLVGHGIPAEHAAVLAALDTDIAAGAEDRVTDTVERITGRPARGFREFAEAEVR